MSDMDDGMKEEVHSRSGGSQHSGREDRDDDKNERYSKNSRDRTRSRTCSPSPSAHKSHKKNFSRSRSKSRSKSRSGSRSRKTHRSSRYRSRSRSPRRYKSSRYSYSRSRSGSYSPHRSSSRRDRDDYRRSRSRSPMSNRRRHLGNRDNPLPGRCLGVFGLSIYTTEQQLNHIFSKFGPVEKVQVIIDAKTGRSRGFCFVYFENHEDAKAAKEQCTGMEIDGRQIRVDYSITLRAHTPTPGIYMGKPTYMEDRKWKHRNNYDDYHYGGGGRYNHYRRSPSPYYRSRKRYRSRSYSYSPRRY